MKKRKKIRPGKLSVKKINLFFVLSCIKKRILFNEKKTDSNSAG